MNTATQEPGGSTGGDTPDSRRIPTPAGTADRRDGSDTLPAHRAIALVARREIDSRVRTKSFVFGTLGLLLVLGVYALISIAFRDGPVRVGIEPQASAMRPALVALAAEAGDFEFVTVDGDEAELLRNGDLAAVLGHTGGQVTLTAERAVDQDLLTVVQTAVTDERTDRELERVGVDPVEFRQRVASSAVQVGLLEPSATSRAEQFALILASTGLLYVFFIFYGITLAQGVVEEKTSRVVELILSTIRPWQLLAGKLIGVAVVGLIQVVLLGGAVAILAQASGAISLPADIGPTVVTLAVWFLLGFFLFAAMLAAAAARVSRQEDLQGVVQPVMMLITTPFMLGIFLLTKDAHSPATEWLSLVPIFSPILMPARMLLGIAPIWQVVVALLLAAAALALMIRVSGRMYSNSVLRSGSRVRLSEALR